MFPLISKVVFLHIQITLCITLRFFLYSLATYEVGENENDVSSASENGSAC